MNQLKCLNKKKPIFISTVLMSSKENQKSIRLFYNSNHIQLLHTPMTMLDELNLKKI